MTSQFTAADIIAEAKAEGIKLDDQQTEELKKLSPETIALLLAQYASPKPLIPQLTGLAAEMAKLLEKEKK